MEDWKIQRERARCDKPGCPLAAATEYFAVLDLPDCTRRDLCASCFHQLSVASGGDAPIYWKARRRDAGKRGPVLDLVSLRVLFDRLGEVEGERAQGLRYFVALLLLRKRLLKIVDPHTEAEELADFVVIDPRLPDSPRTVLLAPEIDEERMSNLKDELLAAIDESDQPDEAGEPGAAARVDARGAPD